MRRTFLKLLVGSIPAVMFGFSISTHAIAAEPVESGVVEVARLQAKEGLFICGRSRRPEENTACRPRL